jgi:hypothetical protein
MAYFSTEVLLRASILSTQDKQVVLCPGFKSHSVHAAVIHWHPFLNKHLPVYNTGNEKEYGL